MKPDNIGKSRIALTWVADSISPQTVRPRSSDQEAPGVAIELSNVEHQIAQRLIRGQAAQVIADELKLTVLATRTLMKSLFVRLDVHTCTELRARLQSGLSH